MNALHKCIHLGVGYVKTCVSFAERDVQRKACVAVCCSVMQSLAVCCSVLQCDAVCCSVRVHVCVRVHVRVHVRVRVRVCTFVRVSLFAYMCVYMCILMHEWTPYIFYKYIMCIAYVCAYMCIYMNTHTRKYRHMHEWNEQKDINNQRHDARTCTNLHELVDMTRVCIL